MASNSMRQDGENRVGLIHSETARKVSEEMAKAQTKRPEVVGSTLNEIEKQDPEILAALLEVMEVEQQLESKAQVELLPNDASFIAQLGSQQE